MTRPRRCGCSRELEQALDDRGFARLADAVGYAHRAAGQELVTV